LEVIAGPDGLDTRQHGVAAGRYTEALAGGASQQQHREAQIVGVHCPLQGLDRGAEVETDRAEGGRNDQRVECDHQRCQRGQRKHPGLQCLFA